MGSSPVRFRGHDYVSSLDNPSLTVRAPMRSLTSNSQAKENLFATFRVNSYSAPALFVCGRPDHGDTTKFSHETFAASGSITQFSADACNFMPWFALYVRKRSRGL